MGSLVRVPFHRKPPTRPTGVCLDSRGRHERCGGPALLGPRALADRAGRSAKFAAGTIMAAQARMSSRVRVQVCVFVVQFPLNDRLCLGSVSRSQGLDPAGGRKSGVAQVCRIRRMFGRCSTARGEMVSRCRGIQSGTVQVVWTSSLPVHIWGIFFPSKRALVVPLKVFTPPFHCVMVFS